MTEGHGFYVYGVIPRLRPGEPAIPSAELRGIEEQALSVVASGELAAVVSATTVTNFDRCTEAELAQYLEQHQRVHQALQGRTAVVPLSFGTVADSLDDVRALLGRARFQFVASLRKAHEHQELVIQGRWDRQRFLEHLVAVDGESAKLRQEAASSGRLGAFAAKVRFGKRLFEHTQRAQRAVGADVITTLTPQAVATKAGKLLFPDIFFHSSFLVTRAQGGAFDAAVNHLGEKLAAAAPWVALKEIGPLPLYSFLHLNLRDGDFAVIDQARKTLGLPETATRPDIQAAYRALAARHHPDKQALAGDGFLEAQATETMQALNAAYETLLTYYEQATARAPARVDNPAAVSSPLCSFRRAEVEARLLVQER